jgi:diacylglycerol kinase family enzyme
MSRLIVIHNPNSGSAAMLDEVKKAFAHRAATPEYIAITSNHLKRILEGAREDTVIVAAGGDGTINSVAGYLYGTKRSLGVIPTGTLNHFAKALNIPLDPAKAVDVILARQHRRIDVGVVNEHVFINNSSIGIYPHSLRVRDSYDDRIGKWPAALLGFARAILNPHHYRIDLTIDGKKQTFRTPFVFIGNNEYGRTQPDFGERTTLAGGQLAVYVIKALNPLAVIRIFAHALFTRKRRTKDFVLYLAEECTIHTRRHHRIKTACDGEVVTLNTPLRYHSAHKTLRVIVP